MTDATTIYRLGCEFVGRAHDHAYGEHHLNCFVPVTEPLLSRVEWEATIDPDVLLLAIEKRIDTAGQPYWLTEDLGADIIHEICAVKEDT